MWKTLAEKGACATWDVKPTAVYQPLLARAAAEKLLRVEDRVREKIDLLRAEVEAADERVSRAVRAAEASSPPVGPPEIWWTGARRREQGWRGRWEGGRGRGPRPGSRRSGRPRPGPGRPERAEPKPRFQSFSAAAEEEKVGGLGGSDVVAAIVFGLRSCPGPQGCP